MTDKERTINQLLAPGVVVRVPEDVWRLQAALRDARTFLADMTGKCHGPRAQWARRILEQWGEDSCQSP